MRKRERFERDLEWRNSMFKEREEGIRIIGWEVKFIGWGSFLG